MMIDWDNHELPISVVSSVFFDQQPYWIRYHEEQGRLEGIGKRSVGGSRIYTLQDVRDMAQSLHRFGIIDGEGFNNCIVRVNSMSNPVFKRKRNHV
jgi:hypothetical protein